MTKARNALIFCWLALAAACVTINVYFPAAAAEKAADQIIDEVWGDESQSPAPTQEEPQSSLSEQVWVSLARYVLDTLVPAAHAQQANIDISSPTIKSLEASMKARHGQLSGYYASGAVGLTGDGLVALRDAKAVPLNQRGGLKGVVAAENADRNALYAEIARANGHAEWEAEIRRTFARRWAERAQPGWYINGPSWTVKN